MHTVKIVVEIDLEAFHNYAEAIGDDPVAKIEEVVQDMVGEHTPEYEPYELVEAWEGSPEIEKAPEVG